MPLWEMPYTVCAKDLFGWLMTESETRALRERKDAASAAIMAGESHSLQARTDAARLYGIHLKDPQMERFNELAKKEQERTKLEPLTGLEKKLDDLWAKLPSWANWASAAVFALIGLLTFGLNGPSANLWQAPLVGAIIGYFVPMIAEASTFLMLAFV